MRLYNTKTRTVEEFIPNNPSSIKMYTCGPTVYNFAHVGNLRCYIQEDLLEKSLNFLGYPVDRCMNITDVGHLTSDADTGEDKMLKGAIREHKTVLEIAKFYTDKFFEDFKSLNIKKPDKVVPATTEIGEYIKIISKLMDTGYAYFKGGNVYFDTSKLKEYYVLTNHKEDEMMVGVRDDVEEDTNKKNKADFVLWFTKSKFENQELKWESPWGLGYPGWHIECSGISLKYLGENLDIHCGGVDNIFPHHTNEIAQSESYIGHKWCNYWFHVEHLNDESGKMSKSKGEFLTLDLLRSKGYDPLVYRLFCIMSHYRKQLVFSYAALDNTANTYKSIKNKIVAIKKEASGEVKDYDKYLDQFKNALADDINTSLALTALFDTLKAEDINNNTKLYLIGEFDKVLSLDLLKDEEVEIPDEIKKLVEDRNNAKKEKDYAKADQIRALIEEKGYLIKDT
ncbi:MAG: cysteine--tRNA ligase, partial [Bacilli bacterium]|nr:cysteine--tRNA ligase [Bacilli bacterium]